MAENSSNTLLGILPLFAFSALLITGVVETVLSARWHKKYFTAGVSLLVIAVPVKVHHTNIPSCQLLKANFKSNWWSGPLLFKELDTNSVGFRESLLRLRTGLVVHGLLIFDEKNSQVIVKGFIDWSVLCFALIWLIIPPLMWLLAPMRLYEPPWLIALAYFGILFINAVIFYLTGYRRFLQVATFAAQAWSRKYALSVDGV
jgi:hypothetical protein